MYLIKVSRRTPLGLHAFKIMQTTIIKKACKLLR